MLIESSQLSLCKGSVASILVKTDSGNQKTSFFCGACGTHIWNDNGERPGVLGFRPGTLDDTSWFVLAAHIWTISKQPWVELSPNIPAFEKDYLRALVWPAESLARLQVSKFSDA